jgi:cytidine deaminase
MDYKKLIEIADEARKNSYSPYSNFSVGAALLTKSGKVYTGTNVENASYSPTICAESSAIVKAVSEGEMAYEAVAVISSAHDYTTPCGVCRQRIFEFGEDIMVICAKNPDDYIKMSISELLPRGFNRTSLMKGTNSGK